MRPADTALFNARTCRAFSLIEAAIVLGVVGVVIGGIWAAASAVNESLKINRMTNDIIESISKIQLAFSIKDAEEIIATEPVPEIPVMTAVRALELLPKDWIWLNSYRVVTPFGGRVYLYFVNTATTRAALRLSDINRSHCIKLVSKLSTMAAQASPSNSTSWSRTSIGVIEVRDSDFITTLSTRNFPIAPAAATEACDEINSIVLQFGLYRIN